MAEYGGYNDPRSNQGEPLEIQEPDNSVVNPENSDVDGGQQVIDPQQSSEKNESFDPNSWALNYKGQQIIPRDKQHLIDLAQQGHSFSQKMEKMNAREAELNDQSNRYKEFEILETAMGQHPELAEQIKRVYSEYNGGGQPPQQQPAYDDQYQDPRIGQLMETVKGLESRQVERINSQADMELDKTINALKEKYPDQPWGTDTGEGTLEKRLIQHALNNDITDLNVAYRNMMWDTMQANTATETLRKHKDLTQKNFKNGIVDTGNTYSSQGGKKPQYSSDDDYGDLTRKAIALMGE